MAPSSFTTVDRRVSRDRSLYGAVVRHLGPHGPDGLLAFLCLAAAISLTSLGFDQWLTTGLVLVLYALYAVRQTRGEGHKERAAELEVEKLEAELAILRQREASRLSKAREKKVLPVSKERKR